jgi:RHS repeat-associated protein
MLMPGRHYDNGASYRYGFNGKENDEMGTQDYGMRIYNPALGKFLSVDPLAMKFPFFTPYQFAGNSPIMHIDLDGCEPKKPGKSIGETRTGTNKGSNVAASWTWNGTVWEEASHSVTVYSSNYHQRIKPVIEDLYFNEQVAHAANAAKELVCLTFSESEVGKEVLGKLPGLPGGPSALDAIKNIVKNMDPKDGAKLYEAAKNWMENREKPVDAAIYQLISLAESTTAAYLNYAYKNIVQGIFMANQKKEKNVSYFGSLDLMYKNTYDFNTAINYNSTMVAKPDYVGVITVTKFQFYQIMNDKFFVPSQYRYISVDKTNINYVTENDFGGDKPAFYIYFNKLAQKGFLHISEVGVHSINVNY